MQTIHVLDVPLYAGDIPGAVEHIIHVCAYGQKENRCISATGAHGMVIAKKEKSFSNLLQSFYMNLPDGMPGVWVGRLKGAKRMDRCYGPGFFAAMMKESASTQIKHFLCGGKEGVADKLKKACEQKFNNNNIVGTFCPPFKPIEEIDFVSIAEIVNNSNTDIVWIGISTPKQEMFARELAKHTNVHFIITVGAAFDFHIGQVRQASKHVQRVGLEWLFRLFMEPRRLYKRYLEIVPLFIFYNLKEFIKHITLFNNQK